MSRRDRMVSLPPWETLDETEDDSEDEDEDELRSNPSSQVTRPSAASSSVRSAPVAGPSFRPPASTQPPLATGTALSADPLKRGKEVLAKLNTPGKQQPRPTVPGAMPPPSQSASQKGKERAPAIPATQPSSSKSTPAVSASSIKYVSDGTSKPIPVYKPYSSRPSASQPLPRPRVASSVSAPGPSQVAKTSVTTSFDQSKGKEKNDRVIEIEDSDDDVDSVAQSQGPPRTKMIATKSGGGIASKKPTVQTTSPSVRPAPEDNGSVRVPQSQRPRIQLARKSTGGRPPRTSMAQSTSPNKQSSSFIRASSTSSGDEFPSLSQIESAQPRRFSASGSLPGSHVPGSSISQGIPKSRTVSGTTLRGNSDKLKTVSKNLSKSSSISANGPSPSQAPKRATRDEIPKSAGPEKGKRPSVPGFSATQPASASTGSRPGPHRSTQPKSASAIPVGSQSKTTARPPVKPKKPTVHLGTIDLSSDDEKTEAVPQMEKKATSCNKEADHGTGDIIDLTLEDDDMPSISTLATQPASSSKDPSAILSKVAGASTHSSHIMPETGSPPAVRPKPHISAIPKEKMASRKPQPADSRPLDVSRRRSDVTGEERDESASIRHASTGEDGRAVRIPETASPLTSVTIGDKDDAHTDHRKSPAGHSESNSTPEITPSTPQNATESFVAEQEYDFDTSEPMDIYTDGFDTPVAGSSNLAPSVGITIQPVDAESSSETGASADGKEKKAEETSAPIERARALRSPPASMQIQEVQSQFEDANEVDLLLGPSIANALAAELPIDVSEEQENENLSTEIETAQKPETLTDKLDMMDLSRPSTTGTGQNTLRDLDVVMADREKDHSAEDDIPTVPPQVMMESETDVEPAAKTGGSEPRETVDNDVTPSVSVATPSNPESNTQAASSSKTRFIRGVSPGAAIPPQRNFGGLYFGSKTRASPHTATRKDTQSISARSPEGAGKESVLPEVTWEVNEKVKESNGGVVDGEITTEPKERSSSSASMHSLESASKSMEPLNATEVYEVDAAKPPNELTATTLEQRQESMLSPESRAKLRIPDARPPRPLMIPATPLTNLRVADGNESGRHSGLQLTEFNQNASTAALAPAPLVSEKQRKESLEVTREIASKFPGFSHIVTPKPPKAIPSPMTNIQRAASSSSSDLFLKPDSMPYVKKRIKEHTMQSPSTSASSSPINESSALPGQPKPESIPRPSSPKQFKSFHSSNAEVNTTPEPSIPVVRTDASSEEVSTAVGVGGPGDRYISNERPKSRAGVRPDISAAPSSRFQVARKCTSKRHPKAASSSSKPLQYTLQEREIQSSSVSQRQIRKRTMSISSGASSGIDELGIPTSSRRTASKRPRVQYSTDEDEEDPADDGIVNLRVSSRQPSRLSAASTLRSSSASSADPIALLDGDEPLGDDSESSDDQPITPVSDLAGAVGDIAIAPKTKSKYPVEVDRYFLNRDYSPTWYSVDEIPKDLVDEVNDTPDWCKNPVLLRQIFESAIVMNTTDDEPEAPPIRIINDNDDEPTPPFEFYYTNRMYHGHGVPPPEYRNLQGCSCIGRCDPRSRTCACAVRQRKNMLEPEDQRGFVYDDKGRVQQQGYPIFECNDACGCTDDCSNRVVQLGRKCLVNIVKTKDKGWGVFAGKKIHKGTFIGIYSGEILIQAESIRRGLVYNKVGKTYLFDIDFYHIPSAVGGVPKYCVDAYHVGNFTRFLNHSCDANSRINAVYINDANIEKALLVIFAMKDINAGEEICFNYRGEDDDDEPLDGDEESLHPCLCNTRKCRGKLLTYTHAPEA